MFSCPKSLCMHVCIYVYVWVISYVSRSPLALSLFKHLQIHADRLLNGVFGDERDKVFDVSLPVGRQLVDSWLPHHGLGDLSGVGWEVKRCVFSTFSVYVFTCVLIRSKL